MNAARPLMRCGVAELKAMVALYKTDLNMLAQLEQELMHRQVPRAVELLAQVQAIIAGHGGPGHAAQAQRKPLTHAPQASLDLEPSLLPEPLAASEVGRVAVPSMPADNSVVAKPLTPLPPDKRSSTESSETIAIGHAPMGKPSETVDLTMTLSEAYKTLQANPSSSWESIEMLRRQLVQPSHPRWLEKVAAVRCEQIIQEARRVNTAYGMVARARCGLS